MTVYVFGNPDVDLDSKALAVAKHLKNKIPGIEFKVIPPSPEISFANQNPVILDVVAGISEVTLITDINHLVLPPRNSVHDFDLGFQLKYLKKLGIIKGAVIIGIPMHKSIDYSLIQSIFRKLVAQDMQGS